MQLSVEMLLLAGKTQDRHEQRLVEASNGDGLEDFAN